MEWGQYIILFHWNRNGVWDVIPSAFEWLILTWSLFTPSWKNWNGVLAGLGGDDGPMRGRERLLPGWSCLLSSSCDRASSALTPPPPCAIGMPPPPIAWGIFTLVSWLAWLGRRACL